MGVWAWLKAFFARLFGRAPAPEPEVRAKPVVAPVAASATRSAASSKSAPTPAELNPQCAALTAAGDQCKRSARDGSKYCGSHKGYHPKTAANITEAKDTEPAVAGAKDTAPATRKPAKKASKAPTTQASTAKKPAAKATKASDLQPQCGALTAAGDQCKRSSRDGSKYCGSHKGYRPKTAAAVKGAKDTAPAVARAKDTKPATRKTTAPKARPQCGALNAAGDQCANSARSNSKYCGSHKGYRPPTAAAAKAAKDTKPRAKKAADTAPRSRRVQVSEGDYKLFQNGNRFYFSKQSQADVKAKGGAPVYTMPAGRKVVKTANGLPVLKKA